MNLEDFYRGPSNPVQTAIGDIVLYEPTLSESNYFYDLITREGRNLRPLDLIRSIVEKLGFLGSGVPPRKSERPSEQISKQSLATISDEDLEKIAQECINYNVFLFDRDLIEKSKNLPGAKSEELVKLIIQQSQKDEEKRKKLFSSFGSVAGSVFEQLSNTERIRSALTFNSYSDSKTRHANVRDIDILTRYSPVPNISSLAARQTEALDQLRSRLETIAEVSEIQKELVIKSSKTQEDILLTLKDDTVSNEKTSKLNTKLSLVVLLITVVSAIPAWIPLFKQQPEPQVTLLQQLLQSETKSMELIKEQLDTQRNSLLRQEELLKLQEELTSVRSELNQLKNSNQQEKLRRKE